MVVPLAIRLPTVIGTVGALLSPSVAMMQPCGIGDEDLADCFLTWPSGDLAQWPRCLYALHTVYFAGQLSEG